MLKRLPATTAVLLMVAACGETPTLPSVESERPAMALGIADKVSICHLDRDLGTYSSLEVNGNAEGAHRSHGDGRIGDPVPGRPDSRFGADCQPIDAGPGPGACISAAIAAYGSNIGIWSWSDGEPWSVSWDEPTDIRIVGNGGSIASVQDLGGGDHFCYISDSSGRGTLWFEENADDFSTVRAFLLSLTEDS